MNRLHSFFYLIVIFAMGLSACKTTPEMAETTDESTPESQEDDVIVSREQFESGGMVLGEITDYAFPDKIQVNGYIDVPPSNLAKLSVFMEGYVDKIDLLEGDRVQKGQFLLSMVNPAFIQLQQEYLETREQRHYLKSEYERQQTLASENIASQKNFLKAESEYKTLEARFAGLTEKLKLLNIDPEKIQPENLTSRVNIYAPIPGNISDIFVSKGQFVAASDIVLEITNVDHIHVELQVFEKDILRVKENQEIIFQIPGAGSETFEATVHRVGRAIHGEKRTVPVHGHLKDEQHTLVTGMFVEAEIIVAEKNASAIPVEALIEEEDKYFILTTRSTGESEMVFSKKEVSIGIITEQWAEIQNPEIVTPGEKILIKGAFYLSGGGGGHEH
ncbi:MAG: efflux RND transporter periplasmic adaptor subunit [Bacteroidia bacterium]|nr:efflux RND transporter periplasmic adaptor subunit [Bacteroidia bacterium]